MAKLKQALGRGLSALIPDGEDEPSGRIAEIEVARIRPNPFQPREDFASQEIQDLAASIKENGLLQPVVVRKQGTHYEVIYGERRLRAFKALRKARIPALIRDNTTDNNMLSMALIENLQRRDLNDVEVAKAYDALLTRCGHTHESLAKHLGKSRTAISNMLRLLKLPRQVQSRLAAGAISMGHARALLSLNDPSQIIELCREIERNGLSVRDAERLTKNPSPATSKKASPGSPAKKAGGRKDPDVDKMEERLRYALGTAVRIQAKSGKGKIEIEFYSGDDLNRVCGLLLR